MNKKDLKALADAERAAKNAAESAAKNAAENSAPARTAKNAAESAAEMRNALWSRCFMAAVGSQSGWLLAAVYDPQRFESRMKRLGDVADAATNYALNRLAAKK